VHGDVVPAFVPQRCRDWDLGLEAAEALAARLSAAQPPSTAQIADLDGAA
jgi:hypothetical protein